MKKYFNIILFLMLVSCSEKVEEQKEIFLGDLQELHIDNVHPYMIFNLLKAFPIKETCTKSKIYSNLYFGIMKNPQLQQDDTLYVFEMCKKAPYFTLDTSYYYEGFIFLTDSIIKNHPNKVAVFVNKDFNIPKNSKYVFASLGRFLD